MGLSNEISCEAGDFSHCHNPRRFSQLEVLRFYFPVLESWVAPSVLLPNGSSQFIRMQMCDHPLPQLPPGPVHQPPPYSPQFCSCCLAMSPLCPWIPISTPPTGLGEYLFFNSVVVRLPHSSIFWQFWLLFVFKFVVVLLWLCEEAKSIYLSLHLGWKSSTRTFQTTM